MSNLLTLGNLFSIGGIISIVLSIILLIFFLVACISVERTKNETIQMRVLMENINKIEIARYKKEFPKENTPLNGIPVNNNEIIINEENPV